MMQRLRTLEVEVQLPHDLKMGLLPHTTSTSITCLILEAIYGQLSLAKNVEMAIYSQLSLAENPGFSGLPNYT